MPPGESFKQMDIIEVKDAVPAQWSVRFHLWTYEEGRSDLSLELTLIEQGEGYIIELDGIHVL
jgi:hypothetical protein